MAHEAFQTTFTTLVVKGHTIKHQPSVGAWLIKTARNKAISIKRGLATRQKIEQSLGAELADTVQEKSVTDLNQQAEVFAALTELPERYRAALNLCVVHGATHAEAAKELRWPEGTVNTRVRKGLELLKKKLERKGWGAAGATLPAILATNVEAVPLWLAGSTMTAVMNTEINRSTLVTSGGIAWGYVQAHWRWVMVTLVIGLGVGGAALAWSMRPDAILETVAANVPNIVTRQALLRQQNLQILDEQVIPKLCAALKKIPVWNQVRLVKVSSDEMYLKVLLELTASSGNPPKPWLTSRSIWSYNVVTQRIHVNFDPKADGHWEPVREDYVRFDTPFSKMPIKFRLSALREGYEAFEALLEEPRELIPYALIEEVASDPTLQRIVPYLGTWYAYGIPERKCFLFIDDKKRPVFIHEDGRYVHLGYIENDSWNREEEREPINMEDNGRRITRPNSPDWWGRGATP